MGGIVSRSAGRVLSWSLLGAALGLSGCGGSTPVVEEPTMEPKPAPPPPPPPPPPEETAEEPEAPPPKEVPEPTFTENMSVREALDAVPKDIETRNIDQETLGKPLNSPDVYEPCKPGGARVKLRVAVWNGKAVGVDVTTTPANERLAQCIKGRLRELTWEKKVKSLNTIEYQF